jgi:hypothetical protein
MSNEKLIEILQNLAGNCIASNAPLFLEDLKRQIADGGSSNLPVKVILDITKFDDEYAIDPRTEWERKIKHKESLDIVNYNPMQPDLFDDLAPEATGPLLVDPKPEKPTKKEKGTKADSSKKKSNQGINDLEGNKPAQDGQDGPEKAKSSNPKTPPEKETFLESTLPDENKKAQKNEENKTRLEDQLLASGIAHGKVTQVLVKDGTIKEGEYFMEKPLVVAYILEKYDAFVKHIEDSLPGNEVSDPAENAKLSDLFHQRGITQAEAETYLQLSGNLGMNETIDNNAVVELMIRNDIDNFVKSVKADASFRPGN